MPSSQPNYLNTTANGEAQAVFPGGVRINAATELIYPSTEDRRIGWVRESNGALVADVVGSDFLGGGTLDMRTQDLTYGQAANSHLRIATNPTNGSYAYYQTWHPIHGSKIRTGLIMDSAGRSSFVQVGDSFTPNGVGAKYMGGLIGWNGSTYTLSNTIGVATLLHHSTFWIRLTAPEPATVGGFLDIQCTSYGMNPAFAYLTQIVSWQPLAVEVAPLNNTGGGMIATTGISIGVHYQSAS